MKRAIENLYMTCGYLAATLIVVLCVVFALALCFGIFCLEGWIFLLLWNWLAVGLLNAPVLGYWVCVGIVFALNFIGRLIFGHSSKSKD